MTPRRQIVKATARAFRWREMLESGTYASIAEIASAEQINESYVSRVLRLTLLAPDMVKAVLNRRQPPEMTLATLMQRFPVGWKEQRAEFSPEVKYSHRAKSVRFRLRSCKHCPQHRPALR